MARSRIPGWSRTRERLGLLFTRGIWRSEVLEEHSPRGIFYAALRTLALVAEGMTDNRLFTRAAALSYYTLIGMGPMVAVAVMIAGFLLKDQDRELASTALTRLVTFIAPPVAQYSRLEEAERKAQQRPAPGLSLGGAGAVLPMSAQELPGPVPVEPKVRTELVELLDTMIESARSTTGGLFGALVLIIIGIQLLTSIEQTFNQVWGVSQGRSWSDRVVFYWTFISLGAVLGVGSAGLLSASTVASLFNVIPFGSFFAQFLLPAAPVLSFILTTLLLAAFYQFFPNTTVRWQPAVLGAVIVTLLLFLNNTLSIVYVSRVIQSRSLYGSVGIIPVLMAGLYIFWLFLLLGGQITFALQNCNTLTNREVWSNVSPQSREVLALGVFLQVARSFAGGDPPPSLVDIGRNLRVPIADLRRSIQLLEQTGLIMAVAGGSRQGESVRYQPARPLAKIDLGDFKRILQSHGSNDGLRLLEGADPLLHRYVRDLLDPSTLPGADQSIERLLQQEASEQLRQSLQT